MLAKICETSLKQGSNCYYFVSVSQYQKCGSYGESAIPVIAEKFAKENWPLAPLLCFQSKERVPKMKALTTLLCIIILHHSIALLGKKYKRIVIDESTWNSMQIGSHSDSEARGLVIRVNFFVKY